MAFHSFLQRRSAPRKMVHLPSLRLRMTGRYLMPFCKKPFFISAHTCPFRQPTVDTLAKGKASHSLLQRRSAPRKVVRLLPDKRGQLSCMSHFGIFSRIKCIFPQKRATVLNTMTLFNFCMAFFIFPLVSGEVPAASSLPASVHLFLCLCLSFPGFLYFALPVFVPSRRGKVSCIHCRFPV